MSFTKNEIIELLSMPFDEFSSEWMKKAKSLHRENGNKLVATAMLGFSNVCKNHCLYCGMSADNCKIKRYRVPSEDIISMAEMASSQGMKRLFLISGEDPHYSFSELLDAISKAKAMGFFISAACGEFSPEQYKELKSAGLDEYVCKFEMSDRDDFNRLNPSTNYEKRFAAIDAIKAAGLGLGSGNIIDYPGCTREKLAEDILLIEKLDVSWAPVIPFMPAVGTALEKERRGDYETNLKALSIIRFMLPKARISAQQPGRDLSQGLGGREGNLAALNAGADVLFTDLLPTALQKNFTVVDNRLLGSLEFIKSLAEESGMEIQLS